MQIFVNFPAVVSKFSFEELVGGPEVEEEDGDVGQFAADELDEVPVVVVEDRPVVNVEATLHRQTFYRGTTTYLG